MSIPNKWTSALPAQLNLLRSSFQFILHHWLFLFGLGMIAGLGRVAQLGGFGSLPQWAGPALEVVVEGSRVAIFLFVLGLANIRKGLGVFLQVFRFDANAKAAWRRSLGSLRANGFTIGLNLVGFLLIASAVNFLIDHLAYETCLLLSMKGNGLLAMESSEWTVLLFFKNILVIPFTLVFEVLLVIWIARSQFEIAPPKLRF
jgi:hypothetical protein